MHKLKSRWQVRRFHACLAFTLKAPYPGVRTQSAVNSACTTIALAHEWQTMSVLSVDILKAEQQPVPVA